MQNSFAVVEKEKLVENMELFLEKCQADDRNPSTTEYNKWIYKTSRRGKSQTIYKKIGSFAKFRDRIADRLNYHPANLCRRYTEEEIIKAPQKCLEEEGNLKYQTYNEWSRGKKQPSSTAIRARLNTTWAKIRRIYGNLNEEHVGPGYWNIEKCTENFLKYPEIKDMSKTEYSNFRKGKKIPTKNTIRRYFGSWNQMKEEVFGVEIDDNSKSDFCRVCAYVDNCKYDYNLKKCEWV